MANGFQLLDFVDNLTIWSILLLALFCYSLEFNFILAVRDKEWQQQVGIWLKVLPVLLGALPLLGLFGTISGLLATFRSMAVYGGLDQQTLLGSGIADALITTQLGLIMVIPGLLLFGWIRYQYRRLSRT